MTDDAFSGPFHSETRREEKMSPSREFFRKLLAGGLFLALLGLYFFSSVPGLGTEDSAELAAGARLLTMVHAPGYPLYLLLGKLFCLPESDSRFQGLFPGHGLVLFSVLTGAAAIALLFLFLSRRASTTSAAAGALTLGFAVGFWKTATEIEVYSLQFLLFIALLAVVRAAGEFPTPYRVRLLGLLLGISLAHHIGVLIHIPALALYVAWHWKARRRFPEPGDAGAGLLYLLFGLAAYSTLLALSARPNPPFISWKPIRSLPMLLHVATGAGFKRLLFHVPFSEVMHRLLVLPLGLLLSLPVAGIFFSLVGIPVTFRRDLPWAALLTAVAAVSIFHTANYDVLDPERFVLPALLPLAIFAGEGFRWIEQRWFPSNGSRGILILIFIASALVPRFQTGFFSRPAERTFAVDAGRAILRYHEEAFRDTVSVRDEWFPERKGPPASSVIWCDWHFYPVLKYFQLVEKRGTHVLIFMDTDVATPGRYFLPGRTFTLNPSLDLGDSFFLAMDHLQWRVEPPHVPEPVPEEKGQEFPDSEILGTSDGISIVRADFSETLVPSRPVPVDLYLRRSSNSSDTVILELILKRDGVPIMVTPGAPLGWHFPPKRWTPEAVYRERTETILPSGAVRHRAGSVFSLHARLRTATADTVVPLGTMKLQRKKSPSPNRRLFLGWKFHTRSGRPNGKTTKAFFLKRHLPAGWKVCASREARFSEFPSSHNPLCGPYGANVGFPQARPFCSIPL